MSRAQTIFFGTIVFMLPILMAQQLRAEVLFEEDFSTDVIASGDWTATDASVTVDVTNGWLHIAPDFDYNDGAYKFTAVTLPAIVEIRMRLVSGGRDYTTPSPRLYFGPTEDDDVAITYLPNTTPYVHWGWHFLGVWTDVHTMGPEVENTWLTIKAIIRVDGGELLAKLDEDEGFTAVVARNWTIPNQIVRLALHQPWDAVCDFDYVRVLSEGQMIGAICGAVTHDNGDPVANVTVKVIDSDNNQIGDPVVTGSDGSFYFDSLLAGTYSVMIVTPLGYSVSPGETQTGIEVTGYPCTEVNFTLTPTITSNNCRTIGYWKHQFDVHLSGRGNAQEDSSSLDNYLDLVHLHFNVLGVYIDLENYDFEDAKNVLTVKGGRLMEDRAKQQLFALLLNFASVRIANETVISEDDRVAAEVVTHVASLLNDGDSDNDELAKTVCDLINNGQMIQSGIIPQSPERYKITVTVGVPSRYRLEQNYPNPFNPACEIKYSLPTDCRVTLTIYNALGQRVKVLVDERQPAGNKSVIWDGRDDQGREVTSGVYFYRIEAGDFVQSKKMVLLK